MGRKKRVCLILYLTLFQILQNIAVCQNPIDNQKASETLLKCLKPKCECCITKDCGDCNGNCIEGIFGIKCLNKCPERCVSCMDYFQSVSNPDYWGFGICTKCKPGFYSTAEYFQCNYECPDGCFSCLSETQCSSCKRGYFLELSSPGFGECTACPKTCVACGTLNFCSECRIGFEGNACQNCVAGFYGENCHQTCSQRCKDGICARSTGDCIRCKEGFNGSKCDRCVEGRHGELCNLVCPENCKDSTCGRYNGRCTNGCKDNFDGDACDSFSVGKHGANCSENHPAIRGGNDVSTEPPVQVSNPIQVWVVIVAGMVAVVFISIIVVLSVWLRKTRRDLRQANEGTMNMSYGVQRGSVYQVRRGADDELNIPGGIQEPRVKIHREKNSLIKSEARCLEIEPVNVNQQTESLYTDIDEQNMDERKYEELRD